VFELSRDRFLFVGHARLVSRLATVDGTDH
jgi:hypothetical protein